MGTKAKAWIGVFGFVVIVGSCQNALNDDDLPAKVSALSTNNVEPVRCQADYGARSGGRRGGGGSGAGR